VSPAFCRRHGPVPDRLRALWSRSSAVKRGIPPTPRFRARRGRWTAKEPGDSALRRLHDRFRSGFERLATAAIL
jgi:hypothetical protein